MKWMRGAVVVAVLLGVGVALASGGSRADSVQQRYLEDVNELRTVARFGTARRVTVRSLGDSAVIHGDPRWLARARPLAAAAPKWAQRMYRRSLLVLHALTDPRTGAVVAGAREGWEYVWPRDASTVALALASAGYHGEARRVAHFLLRLDLGAAARFYPDGSPVDGRAAQGDAAGWVAAAARATGVRVTVPSQPWRDRADYQEGDTGDFLANAIASTAADGPRTYPYATKSSRGRGDRDWAAFEGAGGSLVRQAWDAGSGLDSAAAWAVRPFSRPALYPLVRRTLLRLAAKSGRFGIVPSEGWDGGVDPWTAPTAWTAWSLAALGEQRAALHLMAELRCAVTPAGLLPERVDARTGVPTSTTPLAWSHAFAILALRQLWPQTASTSPPSR